MNKRLKQLRSVLGFNQRDFSERINVGASTLAMFETGQRELKDIHIAAICREFNVNENWLRTGEGEMFQQITKDEEIAKFIGEVLSTESDTFKKRLIFVLAKLDESGWDRLELTLKELYDAANNADKNSI